MKTSSQLGRTVVAVNALGMALAIASCASTKMTSTWTDPSAKGASLSKIAVMAMTKDPSLRRMAEDTAAAQLPGAHAVPSYQVLGDTDLKDRDAVKAKLKEQGFEGVLFMRLAGVTEQVSPVAYGTFDGYYDFAAAPVYVQTDTIVHVVSNLYSLRDDKLIWSGVSQTFDPASAQATVSGVAKAVAISIEKEHLVL